MENKTYTFDIYGWETSVTMQEVLTFYGPHHGLTQENISNYAARYAAHMKHHRACGGWLSKALVERLIEEERLMKEGESDSFKVQLTFAWYVELMKEGGEHLPFRYVLHAWCLNNPQSCERRYVTLESALLHCLNGFNESVAVQNRYASIEQYLNDPGCK